MTRWIAAMLLASFGMASAADDGIRTERIHFKVGQSGTSIKSGIVGYESISYVLGAEAGQTMTVPLKASNLATYFNVYGPGKGPGDQAIANSGLTGPMIPKLNSFKGKLPTSGEYTISVYQGGPDYWEVKTSGSEGRLRIRASASSKAKIIGNLSNGTVLRNRGCRMAEGRRWCQVATVSAPRLSGWTAGAFLRESSHAGSPAPGLTPSRDARVPGTKFMRPATSRARAQRGNRWPVVSSVSSARRMATVSCSGPMAAVG